jgi:hypothetical protein
MMKIGELVKDNIGKMFQHCESDPAELLRLMSAEYCRRTFGLAWPFWADVNKLSTKDHCRYWAERYVIGDQRVRVCSQWFERQRDAFCDYLAAKQIALASAPRRALTPGPGPCRAAETTDTAASRSGTLKMHSSG